MYMTYSHTNNSRSLHRSTTASKGLTSNPRYTKALFRFLIIAVILGTVFFFGAMVQAYAASSSPASGNLPAQTASKAVMQEQVVIQAGDTLWDIAVTHKKKGENTRSYVDKIRSKNHLTTSSLKEGQVLLLP